MKIFILLIFTIFIFFGLVHWLMPKLVFFPEKLDSNYKFSHADEEMNLELKNGAKINALKFIKADSKEFIIYFHGNAGSLSGWQEVGKQVSDKTGMNLIIMDYPGFGKSEGDVPGSEKGLYETGKLITEHIIALYPDYKLVFYGRSIGSAIASNEFSKHPGSKLILETPYISLKKLGKELYPFLPIFLNRFDLDNEKNLQGTDSKEIFIIHGTRDEIIPYSHGSYLQDRFKTKFLSIEGGMHNNLSIHQEFWDGISNFLKK